MKRIHLFIIAAALLLGTASAAAQEKIILSTPKLTQQLASQWAQAYHATHPEVEIDVVSSKNESVEPSLSLTFGDNADATSLITYVARYAIIPVTSADNSRWSELSRRRFGNKELRALFFDQSFAFDDEDEDNWETGSTKWADVTIYSSVGKNSLAAPFAQFFGESATSLRGKKIVGDDSFVLNALAKDPESVSFNSLNYLFDLKSRSLKEGLAVLPLKLKKEQAQALSGNNLDAILEALEDADSNTIAVGRIGFSLKTLTPEVSDFISWVIDQGQQVNHDEGFLKVDKRVVRAQKEMLDYLVNN